MRPIQVEALRLSQGLPATASNLTKVSERTNPDEARWAFSQWDLRERAKDKFRLAQKMLFDRDALEMATHEQVAAYHASCFPENVWVEDWTCGIGADLIAFAKGGKALGLELDPIRAGYAIHNLEVHGLADNAEVHIADCLKRSAGDAEYSFCDPSRRVGSRRTLEMTEFSPDPNEIARRFQKGFIGGIKLSPMLPDSELESLGGNLEFVSFKGECREALVWIGSEVTGPIRSAVHVETREVLPAGGDPTSTPSPMAFLYASDPAAIRAHCLGTLGSKFGLLALGDSNGYLTGSKLVESPWLDPFEVLAWHSADVRRTQSELKRLGGGTPIIKSRGAKVDVEKLRRDLRGEGEELVVVVYPDGRSLKHVICRRV